MPKSSIASRDTLTCTICATSGAATGRLGNQHEGVVCSVAAPNSGSHHGAANVSDAQREGASRHRMWAQTCVRPASHPRDRPDGASHAAPAAASVSPAGPVCWPAHRSPAIRQRQQVASSPSGGSAIAVTLHAASAHTTSGGAAARSCNRSIGRFIRRFGVGGKSSTIRCRSASLARFSRERTVPTGQPMMAGCVGVEKTLQIRSAPPLRGCSTANVARLSGASRCTLAREQMGEGRSPRQHRCPAPLRSQRNRRAVRRPWAAAGTDARGIDCAPHRTGMPPPASCALHQSRWPLYCQESPWSRRCRFPRWRMQAGKAMILPRCAADKPLPAPRRRPRGMRASTLRRSWCRTSSGIHSALWSRKSSQRVMMDGQDRWFYGNAHSIWAHVANRCKSTVNQNAI